MRWKNFFSKTFGYKPRPPLKPKFVFTAVLICVKIALLLVEKIRYHILNSFVLCYHAYTIRNYAFVITFEDLNCIIIQQLTHWCHSLTNALTSINEEKVAKRNWRKVYSKSSAKSLSRWPSQRLLYKIKSRPVRTEYRNPWLCEHH